MTKVTMHHMASKKEWVCFSVLDECYSDEQAGSLANEKLQSDAAKHQASG